MTTEQKHTPEPWREQDGRIVANEPSADNDEVLICDVAPDNHALTEFDEFNARRIVACVNACAGISNEHLELLSVAQMVAAAVEQRDELVGALREIKELTSRQQLPITAKINDIARAALAKVQA
jgi:hypothetical protein